MRTLSCVVLFLLTGGAAAAQTYEISVLAAYPRIGRAPLGSISETRARDDDTRLKGEYGYGVRLTRNTKGYYGHEIGFIYSRGTLQTTTRKEEGRTLITTTREGKVIFRYAFYNFLMYFMPKGERFRPFITVGLQAHQYGAPAIPEWDRGGTRNYGGNYGGGMKIKLFKNALVRFDVRQYIGGKPYDLTFEDQLKSGGLLRQLEGSFGVAITF